MSTTTIPADQHHHAQDTFRGKRLLLPAIVLLSQLPLLIQHGHHLWQREHYRFFPVLLVFIAVLLWQRWPRTFEPLAGWQRKLALILTATGSFLLVGGTALFAAYLSAVGTILIAGGMILWYGGRGAMRGLFSVWLLSWLLIPPPLNTDYTLIAWLQTFTSRATGVLLELLAVDHLVSGNVLKLPNHTLFVEQACSGVQSLFALLTATAIYVIWQRTPWVRAACLLASVGAWALFGNTLRVFLIAYVFVQSGVDLSTGWQHELLGCVVFAVALGMLVCTDQILSFFLDPIDAMSPIESEQSPFSKLWNRVFGLTEPAAPASAGQQETSAGESTGATAPGYVRWIAAGCCLLGVVQAANWSVARLAAAGSGGASWQLQADQAAEAIEQNTLPESHNQWVQVDFKTEHRGENAVLGEYSRTWTYHSPSGPAIVSCDYPFPDWHDLTQCYMAQGWQPVRRSVARRSGRAETARGPFVEFEMAKPTGEMGYLIFGLFDGAGQDLTPLESDANFFSVALDRLQKGLRRGPLGIVSGDVGPLDSEAYQVQLFVTTDKPLLPGEQSKLREQFNEFRLLLKRHWNTHRDELAKS